MCHVTLTGLPLSPYFSTTQSFLESFGQDVDEPYTISTVFRNHGGRLTITQMRSRPRIGMGMTTSTRPRMKTAMNAAFLVRIAISISRII